MKVLYMGRAHISRIVREKLNELAKCKDLKVGLIAPKRWTAELKKYCLEDDPDQRYELFKSNLIFFRNNSSLVFYFPLLKYLLKFKPDIIHIEEEPWLLASFQIIFLSKLFLPKTKIISFTWENIYHDRKFPLSFFESYSLKHSDFMIAGNKDGKEILLKKDFKNKIKVLPHIGINLSLYKKRKKKTKKFTVGYVGRLIQEKGLDSLFKAFAGLKDSSLLIVGDGPYKKDLMKLAEKLNIKDRVKFTGTVPFEKVPDYMSDMDVLVLPSLTTKNWKEQFAYVILEAMACEVPVVASSSGENPNSIGDAGLIFKENDERDLLEKINKIKNDKRLRNNLIKKGKKRVLNFTTDKIVKETYKIYKELF